MTRVGAGGCGFAALFGGLVIAGAAAAHDWYDFFTTPDGEPCCGGKECAPLADGDAVEVTGGFRIRSLGITVPYAGVQQSPDTHFHACVWWTPKQEVKCFFVPQPAT
jgi:hypothetical protein